MQVCQKGNREMSKFTTRVELHNADEDDYSDLHAAMEDQGFSRLIASNDGITYRLPTAEYNLDEDWTLDQVLSAAKKAAATTGREFAVLVTESNGRKWHGLEKA
jgi:hypothetical protein